MDISSYSYFSIVSNIMDKKPSKVHKELSYLKLKTLATHLKNKFPEDKRTLDELADLIIEEYTPKHRK